MRPEGIEPPAYRFEACRSIHLSYGRVGTSDECSPRSQGDTTESAHIGVLKFKTSLYGPVAQLAEQQTLNLRVVGSIPTRLTIFSSAPSDGVK